MAWGDFSIWGIFDQSGNPVFDADSVAAVEYQNTFRISDYPVEQGSFFSYNKVKVPFITKVTFLKSGAFEDRSDFLDSLESAVQSLDLFVVVTPEISYPNANITFFTYRRTSRNGVQLLRVEVWCEEVRIVQTGQLSNTQSTNGADPQQNGSEQPTNTGPNGSPNLISGTPVTSSTTGTTGQTPPFIAPNSGLGVPPGSSPSTAIETPNIGPAFFTPNNLPEVPNTYNLLTPQQQSTTLNLGQSNSGISIGNAYPPDSNGNSGLGFNGAVPGF